MDFQLSAPFFLTYPYLFQLVHWTFSILFGNPVRKMFKNQFGKEQFVLYWNEWNACLFQNEHIAMDMNNFDTRNRRKKKSTWSKIEISSCCQELLSMLVFSCFALNQSAYYHKSPDKLTKRLNNAEKSKNVLFGVMWENRGCLDQKQRFIFIVQVDFYPLKWNWIVLFKLFQISLSDE